MSVYRDIRPLDRRDKVWMVFDENNTIYIRKRLLPEETGIYERLRAIRPRGVPKIREIYSDGGNAYLIEEYIDGITLQELIDRGRRFDKREVLRLVYSLCRTLAPIHRRGMVHRDITASNVVISHSGEIYLIDFGNARMHKRQQSRDTEFIGTEGYAAPEQFGFGQSGRRTDIYAVGVLMNIMLTGAFPHEEKPKGRISKIIRKCTSVKPKDRYRSVRALRLAMLRVKHPFLLSWPAAAAYSLVVLMAVLIFMPYSSTSGTYTPELPEITSIERTEDVDSPILRRETAEMLIRTGRYDEAQSYLDSLAEKGIRDQLEIILYSQNYEAQGRYDEAANVVMDYIDTVVGTYVWKQKNSYKPWLRQLYPNCSDEVKRRIDALPSPDTD